MSRASGRRGGRRLEPVNLKRGGQKQLRVAVARRGPVSAGEALWVVRRHLPRHAGEQQLVNAVVRGRVVCVTRVHGGGAVIEGAEDRKSPVSVRHNLYE